MLFSGRRIPGGRGQPGLAFQEATGTVCVKVSHCLRGQRKSRSNYKIIQEKKGSQEQGPGTALREL